MKKVMKKMPKRGMAKLKTKAAAAKGKKSPKTLKAGDKGDKMGKVKGPGKAKKMSEKAFEKKYGDQTI